MKANLKGKEVVVRMVYESKAIKLNCIILDEIKEGGLRGFLFGKNVDNGFSFYLNPFYIVSIEVVK